MRIAVVASLLALAAAACGGSSSVQEWEDGGYEDAGIGDARDARLPDRCPEAPARIDASCSLGFDSPVEPYAQALTVVKEVETTAWGVVVRVFVDAKGILLVADRLLVRIALDGTSTIIDNPTGATALDAAQGATSYGLLLGVGAGARLCIVKDDTFPSLATCASSDFDPGQFARVQWDGTSYWTFGQLPGPVRRAAAYDEDGVLLEEHTTAPGPNEGFIDPHLLGDRIVDIGFGRGAQCDTTFADVRPRTLDASAVTTTLLPDDFMDDLRFLWRPVVATSPTRALALAGGTCGDWVAGTCGYWRDVAPAALLATVLDASGAPVALQRRLPDMTILALRWDGQRFVALTSTAMQSCCGCEAPPPGGKLGLAVFDAEGTLVARGDPVSGFPAVWSGNQYADVALFPNVGYVLAYVPYQGAGYLRVALVTAPPP